VNLNLSATTKMSFNKRHTRDFQYVRLPNLHICNVPNRERQSWKQ